MLGYPRELRCGLNRNWGNSFDLLSYFSFKIFIYCCTGSSLLHADFSLQWLLSWWSVDFRNTGFSTYDAQG